MSNPLKTLLSRLVTPVGEQPLDVNALAESLTTIIDERVHAAASRILEDVEWRHAQTLQREAGMPIGQRQATAEDFNLLTHALTGYTVTANMNAAGVATPGSIRWQSLHIVYQGVDYTVADGGSALKYHTFVKPASGTTATLTSSDTKPVLGPDDVLVFINNAGTPVVPQQGQGSLPQAVADGTVDNGALVDGAVAGAKIANSGIGAGKLGTGAISAAGMFATKVINTAAIGDLAVTSGQLGGQAVTAGKVAAGAINSNTLFTAGVVDNAAVASGAVTAVKLNTLTHVFY